jgi:ABC-type transport system substrate-binding protein
MMRLTVLLTLILVVVSGVAGAQVLNVGVGADAVRLDPPDQTDNVSEIVLRHIMDGLVEFDEQLGIQPALATSWDVLNDGKTYCFYLRENVVFHDGTPFNAEAVKYNFDRILGGGLRRTSLYDPYIESVEVVDEYTVALHLFEPFGALLHHLAHGAGLIQSPAAIEQYGDRVGRNPVGTGPFVFERWVPGERIVLTANPTYWGGEPKISGLSFNIVPEEATRVFQLEAGESDVIFNVPPTDVARLERSNKVDVLIADSIRVIYGGMSTHKPPFDNVKVRQAFNYAIDQQLIVDYILEGFGTVTDSIIAPLTTGYYSTGGYPHDPERAKELLAEAGYPQGLTVNFWTPNGRYLKDYETSLVMQQMLAEAGINAELQIMEWGAYISAIFDVNAETAEAELYLLGWAPSTGDADWVLRPLFSSEHFPPLGDNASFYANPALDEAIRKAMTEPDPVKRNEYYQEGQQIIHDEAVMIPLHVLQQIVAKSSSVEGVKILPIEIVLLKDAYVK